MSPPTEMTTQKLFTPSDIRDMLQESISSDLFCPSSSAITDVRGELLRRLYIGQLYMIIDKLWYGYSGGSLYLGSLSKPNEMDTQWIIDKANEYGWTSDGVWVETIVGEPSGWRATIYTLTFTE